MKEEILKLVSYNYLNSQRFNGFKISDLLNYYKVNKSNLLAVLEELINDGFISIVYGNVHPNPHIRALDDLPINVQIEMMGSELFKYACVYPLKRLLMQVVDVKKYENRPFSLELALGQTQLAFRFFDLSVLENYRNDPRYRFWSNDVNGNIYVRKPDALRDADDTFLETFGFGYEKNLKQRVVTSLLWYISCLSSEHQMIWKAKQVQGDYFPHPDYYRNNIIGDFAERMIVFDAILSEMKKINECCKAIGWDNLFKRIYENDTKPDNFGFLLRPTLKEYNDFIHTLDKMLSENLNKKFFINIVKIDEKGNSKGTIRLLEEWMNLNFAPKRDEDKQMMMDTIQTLKEIRKQRTKPAHLIIANTYDHSYFEKQRAIVSRVYMALKTLRMMLKIHPKSEKVEISKYLQDGLIWDY